MKRFLYWSGGKDSSASIAICYENGIQLDGIVFCEVMFDHARNISGENPKHIEWVYNSAIPKIESMGYKIRIIRAEKDYLSLFNSRISTGQRAGKKCGWLIGGMCAANSRLKMRPIHELKKSIGEHEQIIGIAADESVRLARLKTNCRSVLAEFGVKEQDTYEICKKYELLSPTYKTRARGGCWFYPNCSVKTFAEFKKEYPNLWAELEKLSIDNEIASQGFRYGRTFDSVNREIDRMSNATARALYNAMQATRNVGSITQATANDLAIERTDEFLYIMTYSFPCQDLSAAGNGAGMSKGSGTRSGLLWEVERLLSEIACGGGNALPQVLLMENVPQVIGGGAIADFVQWREFLERLGYKNYHKLMNAKDYGIPQNRNRCFMVSIRGDYYFTFPKPRELRYRLKDFLDRHVEEKYYLSDATIEMFEKHTAAQQAKGNGFKFEPTSGGGYAKTISTRAGGRTDDNFIIEQGNEARTDNGSCGDDLREGPQRLRQPSNECRSGNAGGATSE